MNPKAQSILSYLGIFWLVAYFAGKEKTDLSRYHLKQGLGLFVIAILFNVAVFVVGMISPQIALIISYAGIVLLIFMILGIIHAVNEVKKPLPLIGVFFENKFPFIDQ